MRTQLWVQSKKSTSPRRCQPEFINIAHISLHLWYMSDSVIPTILLHVVHRYLASKAQTKERAAVYSPWSFDRG